MIPPPQPEHHHDTPAAPPPSGSTSGAPVVDTEGLAELLRVAAADAVVGRVGECPHPILMRGRRRLVDPVTGTVLHDTGPVTVAVRCRNRRASACPACSALYRQDAYQLIAAGLQGGKDTPTSVAGHPRVFVTLTARSFGAVHTGPDHQGISRRCHSAHRHRRRRRWPVCGLWHPSGDPAIGTPLDPVRYDYEGQVLFNAHAGLLWARTTTAIRRALATTAGVTVRQASRLVRVVFAKVAEFQARGVVHLHALIRLDGPTGPGQPPPAWATAQQLEVAVRRAVTTVTINLPAARGGTARRLGWGRRLDLQILPTGEAGPSGGQHSGDAGGEGQRVARYLAKYTTKAAEAVGVTGLGPLYCPACRGSGLRFGRLCNLCPGSGRRPDVDLDRLSPHARALVDTCWRLGNRPEYAHLRLRLWAHQLGYRGHYTTKSHRYSTSFTALRAERRDHGEATQAARAGLATTVVIVDSEWIYHGSS